MYHNKTIAAIIPVYNEEGKIGRLLAKVPRDLFDLVIVINDGSTDGTAAEIEDATQKHQLPLHLISLEKNAGLGVAFKHAFRFLKQKTTQDNKHDTKQPSYDIGIIMGGDDQDNPLEAYQFAEKIVDQGYEIVQGSRYLGKTKEIPLFRLLTTNMYSLFFSLVARKKISDASTGYKAFKIELLSKIDLEQPWLDAKYGIEQYFLMQCVKSGCRFTEIPVKKYFPKEGYTKMRPLIDWGYMLQPIIRSIFT